MPASDEPNDHAFKRDASFVWEDAELCKLLADSIQSLVDGSLYGTHKSHKFKRQRFYREIEKFIPDFDGPSCDDSTPNKYISNMIYGVKNHNVKWPIPILLKWLYYKDIEEYKRFFDLSRLTLESEQSVILHSDLPDEINIDEEERATINDNYHLMAPVFDEDKCYEDEHNTYTRAVGDSRNEVWSMYRVACKGNDYAMFDLGCCIAKGDYYLLIDYQKAAFWWEQSALKGNFRAMYNFGLCFLTGRGAEKNIEDAKFWFRKAADAGSVQATEMLNELDEN